MSLCAERAENTIEIQTKCCVAYPWYSFRRSRSLRHLFPWKVDPEEGAASWSNFHSRVAAAAVFFVNGVQSSSK